jgi:hypothetical protein
MPFTTAPQDGHNEVCSPGLKALCSHLLLWPFVTSPCGTHILFIQFPVNYGALPFPVTRKDIKFTVNSLKAQWELHAVSALTLRNSAFCPPSVWYESHNKPHRAGCCRGCIRETLGSNVGRNVSYLEGFRGFTQSLHANIGIVPRLSHTHFLPNPFQFLYHRSIRRVVNRRKGNKNPLFPYTALTNYSTFVMDRQCFLWGRDWTLKYYLDKSQAWKEDYEDHIPWSLVRRLYDSRFGPKHANNAAGGIPCIPLVPRDWQRVRKTSRSCRADNVGRGLMVTAGIAIQMHAHALEAILLKYTRVHTPPPPPRLPR